MSVTIEELKDQLNILKKHTPGSDIQESMLLQTFNHAEAIKTRALAQKEQYQQLMLVLDGEVNAAQVMQNMILQTVTRFNKLEEQRKTEEAANLKHAVENEPRNSYPSLCAIHKSRPF